MEPKLPSLIDKHVGRRLKWRRKEKKLSQEALADRLGLTFQQIQKYERGANRISAGRLYELAQALDTTIPYFFQGVDTLTEATGFGVGENEQAEFTGLIDTETVDLVVAFQSIPDPKLRMSILDMVVKSAAAFGGDDAD